MLFFSYMYYGVSIVFLFVFFFKQKTAYEMRISDWSSDVCSSDLFAILETHYRDMQDIEFTVQQGKLWMLQTRSGKRTAKAALKIAVDMANEGLITQEEAIARVDPAALDQLLHPTLDPKDRKSTRLNSSH